MNWELNSTSLKNRLSRFIQAALEHEKRSEQCNLNAELIGTTFVDSFSTWSLFQQQLLWRLVLRQEVKKLPRSTGLWEKRGTHSLHWKQVTFGPYEFGTLLFQVFVFGSSFLVKVKRKEQECCSTYWQTCSVFSVLFLSLILANEHQLDGWNTLFNGFACGYKVHIEHKPWSFWVRSVKVWWTKVPKSNVQLRRHLKCQVGSLCRVVVI